MNAICVVETPLQFLSVCSLILSRDNCFQYDLVIRDIFEGAAALAHKARETELFSEVFVASYRVHEGRKPGIRYLVGSIVAQDKQRDRFYEAAPALSGRNYDMLICGSVTFFTKDVKQFCSPDGWSEFVDDGTGSHTGNVFQTFLCLDSILASSSPASFKNRLKEAMRRLLAQILPKKFFFDIRAVHLFNPLPEEKARFSGGLVGELTFQDCQELLPCGSPAGVRCKPYIFLTLPEKACSVETTQIEVDIAALLNELLIGRMTIRLHPRRTAVDFQGGEFDIDQGLSVWELMIAEGFVNENTVLIGFASSAQTMPKYLKNIEPWVIFLHRMIPFAGSVSVYETIYEDLRGRYLHPQKVVAPRSVEELVDLVKKIESTGLDVGI